MFREGADYQRERGAFWIERGKKSYLKKGKESPIRRGVQGRKGGLKVVGSSLETNPTTRSFELSGGESQRLDGKKKKNSIEKEKVGERTAVQKTNKKKKKANPAKNEGEKKVAVKIKGGKGSCAIQRTPNSTGGDKPWPWEERGSETPSPPKTFLGQAKAHTPRGLQKGVIQEVQLPKDSRSAKNDRKRGKNRKLSPSG